jgi:predicted nuclease of predicted toxin-antitoxin system
VIKLLLDQGLPRSAAVTLRESGWDVIHVGEVGLGISSDMGILRYATDQGRTIITLDADFHALLKTTGITTPSVIRFRIEGIRGEELARMLARVCMSVTDDIEQGALVYGHQKNPARSPVEMIAT